VKQKPVHWADVIATTSVRSACRRQNVFKRKLTQDWAKPI